MWLILVALIVGAGVLVWMALAVSDFREPVAEGTDAPSTIDPASPPTAEEPAPSGWALPEFASPASGIVDVAAATSDDLAAGLLGQVVATAPVVVTVDQPTGPHLDVAAELARDLQAPLVVVVVVGGGADAGADDATPSPDTDPTGDASATDDPVASEQPTGPPATDALLAGWRTSQVVAIGTPPTTSATVHEVTVEVPAPDPSSEPTGDGTDAPDATASATPAPAPSPQVTRPEPVDAMLADAASVPAPDALAGVVAVVRPDDDQPLRADVAHALDLVGVETVPFTGDDPRAMPALQESLAGADSILLAIADDQWPGAPPMSIGPTDWPGLFLAAVEAPELVGGGKVMFPDRTLIAAYGNPRGPALGVLGERDLEGSIAYTEDLAAEYEGLFGDSSVVPAFEIIATVASGEPEPDESYSRKEDLDLLTEWVDGATEAGLYVVLDLQPGREDFLTQAKRLEDLLRRPNVGLALDPEWRLAPDEVHIEQIGTVTTAEVNEVSDWLAGIVREEVLPQKLLMIHGFRLSMLTDREDLHFPAELATMLQMDGQGPQTLKNDTYEVLTEAGPDQVWWGWKNFYDEDSPETRSPEDTAAVDPTPYFVSYQ